MVNKINIKKKVVVKTIETVESVKHGLLTTWPPLFDAVFIASSSCNGHDNLVSRVPVV